MKYPNRSDVVWLAALATALSTVLVDAAAAQRYPVRTLSERDGLRSSIVHDLEQDPEGRIWFLTRGGAVRYDGFEWVDPGVRPPHALLSYRFLEVDPEGGVWLAAEDPSFPLLRMDAAVGAASELPTPAPGPVAAERRTSMAVGSGPDGTWLALGTRGSGLHLWRGERWETLGTEDGLPHPSVLALEPGPEGLLVGTAGGLAVLAGGRLDPSPTGLLPPDRRDVRALAYVEREDLVWLVGPDWVGRLAEGRFTVAAEDVAIPPDPYRLHMVAEPDGRGGLFFGTATRLFHLDGKSGRVEVLGRRNGLAAEGATALELDRELNLWVATPRGVSRLSSLRFATWDAGQGLLEDEVSAVVERAPGEMVFGHNGGITIYREGEPPWPLPLERPELPLTPLGRALDLEVGGDGVLWVAMGHLGVARVDPDGDLRWFGGGHGQRDRVDSLRLDRDGQLLLGTGDGLARLAGEEIVPVAASPLDGRHVRRVVLSPGGTLYAATADDGLHHRSRDGTWGRAHGKTAPENALFTILEDSAGKVWVGSTAGLLTLDGDRLVPPIPEALRIDRPVYALVEDPDGALWIGTDSGFSVWDGAGLEHFAVRDGLAGNEANRAGAWVDGRGRLWLGTDGGVSLVRHRDPRPTLPPPPTSLLDLEVDGRSFPAREPLDLGHRQNRVWFRLGAVSFRDESRIEYRTRLEGYERGWTVTTGPARLESRYSALPPGTYVFQAQARSDRSGWSDVVASAPVTIARPFWRQAWFLGACGMVLVGLGYSGHRLHAQNRYARRLEREVELRTTELVRVQKLEALGVLAGGIAHDFNNLLTVILGYLSLVQASHRVQETELEHLEQASRALGRAQELSQRLLTFSRGGSPVTEAVSVARLVRECAGLAPRGSNVRCQVELPEELWPAEADEGQLSQVVNNLLINAVQAMPGGGVVTVHAENVRLEDNEVGGLPAGRYVRLEVADHGVGIPPDALPRVFDPFFTTKESGSGLGLTTVHSIVRQHGGSVRVDSAPGEGARFELFLPASSGRLDSQHRSVPAGGAGSARVLVMDDQEAVRRVLERMLRHLGHEVVGTCDGDEAIARYREASERGEPFDLVILDLTIPDGKGGKETLAELLRLDPGVRAVACSGYSDDPVMSADAGSGGFAAALPKPYTLGRLREVLEELLDDERPARRSA